MFNLAELRMLAINGNKFGLSAGEQTRILKDLAAVTEEELDEFESSFPPPKKEDDKAAIERERVRVADGRVAEKEIEKEKKERPGLYVPRDAAGNIVKSPEAAASEAPPTPTLAQVEAAKKAQEKTAKAKKR